MILLIAYNCKGVLKRQGKKLTLLFLAHREPHHKIFLGILSTAPFGFKLYVGCNILAYL
jgi:hypothetical protein